MLHNQPAKIQATVVTNHFVGGEALAERSTAKSVARPAFSQRAKMVESRAHQHECRGAAYAPSQLNATSPPI